MLSGRTGRDAQDRTPVVPFMANAAGAAKAPDIPKHCGRESPSIRGPAGEYDIPVCRRKVASDLSFTELCPSQESRGVISLVVKPASQGAAGSSAIGDFARPAAGRRALSRYNTDSDQRRQAAVVGEERSNQRIMANLAYNGTADDGSMPKWLNNGDNAWQLTAATLVGMQSVPGLVILYGSMVKKKWAVNSAMMALYAYAAVLICWVGWAYKMSFGEKLGGKQAPGLWGTPGPVWSHHYLLGQANITEAQQTPLYPQATMVFFQFVFAAIAVVLLAGSLLARMNFAAWALFVPLWLTFSYTFGAFSLWGGGFLCTWGVLDYSGGYVIHLSSGIAGFTAAYWVGPRLKADRDSFPPNNLILMLAGAGLLWAGWAGFNGGDPYSANIDASLAVLNTNVAAATSLLVWCGLDTVFKGRPSAVGGVQGLITGLVVITPAAGIVDTWAAIIMGLFSGSVPWLTMEVVHPRCSYLQAVDDVMGGFHTHAVAGLLGGLLTGFFADPRLLNLFVLKDSSKGLLYKHYGQVPKQLVGALYIIALNVIVTSLILLAIRLVVPLRLSDDVLRQGDEAVHGELAFAFSGEDNSEAEIKLQVEDKVV